MTGGCQNIRYFGETQCQALAKLFFNLSQFQTYLGLDAENQGENQGSNVAEDCVPGKDKDKRSEEN